MEEVKDKILEDAISMAIKNEKEKIIYRRLCVFLTCVIALSFFRK